MKKGKVLFWVFFNLILWGGAFYIAYYFNTDGRGRERTPRYTTTIRVDEKVKYDVSNYVETTEIEIEGYNFPKIVLKNVNNEIIDTFNKRMEDKIFSIVRNSIISTKEMSGENHEIKYTPEIFFQVNDRILSIYYMILNFEGIECESDYMMSMNIDLDEMVVLTNEEVINKKGLTLEGIATKEYDIETRLYLHDQGANFIYFDENRNETTVEYFLNEKEKLIKGAAIFLEDVLNAYIKDGKVYYGYNGSVFETLFLRLDDNNCSYIEIEE